MAKCCQGGPLTLQCKLYCNAPIELTEWESRRVEEIVKRRQPLSATPLPIDEGPAILYPPPNVKNGSNMAPVPTPQRPPGCSYPLCDVVVVEDLPPGRCICGWVVDDNGERKTTPVKGPTICEPPRAIHKQTPQEFWDRIAQIEQHDPLSRRHLRREPCRD